MGLYVDKKQVKTSDRYVKGKGEGDQAICYQALQGVVKPFVTRRHIGLGEFKMCYIIMMYPYHNSYYCYIR